MMLWLSNILPEIDMRCVDMLELRVYEVIWFFELNLGGKK